MTFNTNKGFTLIELMIVIAIIGILAAIAGPSYSLYTQKAKYTEISDFAAPAKSAIEICLQLTNDAAQCDSNSDLIPHGFVASQASASTIVDSVVVSTNSPGAISITVTPENSPPNAPYFYSTDTYILDAEVKTRGVDYFVDSWTINATSGCSINSYC